MSVKSEFPMFVYEYDKNGKHGKPLKIETPLSLKLIFETLIKRAVEEKREVIITDSFDFCLFESRNGDIIFPKGNQ